MEKEGANLPNSETEGIVGLSLHPTSICGCVTIMLL